MSSPRSIRRPWRCSHVARVAIGFMGLFFWACRHSQDENAAGRAAQVTRAIEMLRLSSNHDKALWVIRLRDLPCGAPDICELQKTCLGAYNDYLSAVASIELVRKDLGSPDTDASAPDASAERLLQAAAQAQEAQRSLMKSRQPMRQCAENEAVIRQRYKLR